jgi:hypothetical protein
MAEFTSVSIDGRSASRARRQALSSGRAALPPANERVRSGSRSATVPDGIASAAAPTLEVAPERVELPIATPVVKTHAGSSCREVARARRAEAARHGRGDAPAAEPSRPPRIGRLEYAPKVETSQTHAGQSVTGVRIGHGRAVTGDERGWALPISGTQYIGTESGAAARPSAPKVGRARTPGGSVVSGTLVRSSVHVTGDEAGANIAITGEADGRIDDDVTPRGDHGVSTTAQFGRQMGSIGRGNGANLARSAQSFGSRERSRQPAIESTDGGQTVTGSAVGRSIRVTGDEAGACRTLTGDQYLMPARRQAACGGRSGGTAPAALINAERPDPVSGAKVNVGRTAHGRRVTGIDVEHHRLVTGDEPGTCAAITGSSYQGGSSIAQWCDDAQVAESEARVGPRPAPARVTGDSPRAGGAVTGAGRGAGRDITGTSYDQAPADDAALPAQPVAALDDRFSVRSPQRTAHLSAPGNGRITGSFAVGDGKVTGNLEFVGRARRGADDAAAPARLQLTGEGRSTGRTITGSAYSSRLAVTGTEGATAAARNPSRQGSKPRAFAGAVRFKALASTEEPKHLVTGMFGYSSDSAAKVTLSGGAQG